MGQSNPHNSLDGRPPQDIAVKDWPRLEGINWAADGRGWFTSAKSETGIVLLYVDLRGQAHPLWEMQGDGSAYGLPSPDGRYLAICSTAGNSNVWMMESF